jgi:hypothetical protein
LREEENEAREERHCWEIKYEGKINLRIVSGD